MPKNHTNVEVEYVSPCDDEIAVNITVDDPRRYKSGSVIRGAALEDTGEIVSVRVCSDGRPALVDRFALSSEPTRWHFKGKIIARRGGGGSPKLPLE